MTTQRFFFVLESCQIVNIVPCIKFVFSEVLDICCVGSEFYVYDAEGYVKWFGLLSVKECVAKLYEMGEIKQCLTVSNVN